MSEIFETFSLPVLTVTGRHEPLTLGWWGECSTIVAKSYKFLNLNENYRKKFIEPLRGRWLIWQKRADLKMSHWYSVTRFGKFCHFITFYLGTFLHFHLNKQFENMVCCAYFYIWKQLGIHVIDFQFELWNFGCSFG